MWMDGNPRGSSMRLSSTNSDLLVTRIPSFQALDMDGVTTTTPPVYLHSVGGIMAPSVNAEGIAVGSQ
jgi:hypothetical protein